MQQQKYYLHIINAIVVREALVSFCSAIAPHPLRKSADFEPPFLCQSSHSTTKKKHLLQTRPIARYLSKYYFAE